ncbi:hypothetical protein BC828DRAFT_181576 [Blastocladiella britannica]|nr:hypothetical protein BC828DRAFT_181576 [Blastocladiella britannica]
MMQLLRILMLFRVSPAWNNIMARDPGTAAAAQPHAWKNDDKIAFIRLPSSGSNYIAPTTVATREQATTNARGWLALGARMSRSAHIARPRCILLSFVFLLIWAGPSQVVP